MATKQEITQAIQDHLITVTASYLGTTEDDAASHVDVRDRTEDIDLPGFAHERFESEIDLGMHGNPHKIGETVNADEGTYEVLYARYKDTTVDIMPAATDDDQVTVNELYDALERYFTTLKARIPSGKTLHEDVHSGSLSIEGSESVDQTSMGLRSDRFRCTFRYSSYIAVETDLIQTVDVDVEDIEYGAQYDQQTIIV